MQLLTLIGMIKFIFEHISETEFICDNAWSSFLSEENRCALSNVLFIVSEFVTKEVCKLPIVSASPDDLEVL